MNFLKPIIELFFLSIHNYTRRFGQPEFWIMFQVLRSLREGMTVQYVREAGLGFVG